MFSGSKAPVCTIFQKKSNARISANAKHACPITDSLHTVASYIEKSVIILWDGFCSLAEKKSISSSF